MRKEGMGDIINYFSPQEKFDALAKERCSLLIKIVDISDVEDEIKKKIKKVIKDFEESKFLPTNQPYDVFYRTINKILSITKNSKKEERAQELFVDLRNDIWDFFL